MFLFDFVTVILCLVIFSLSIVSIRRLSRTHAIQAHISEEQLNMRTQRARAAVRMVLVSVLLYMYWLPSLIYKAYIFMTVEVLRNWHNDGRVFVVLVPYAFRADSSCDFFSIIFLLTFLPIVNSSISPFIYIIFLRDFQKAAKKVLCRSEILNQIQNRRGSHELQPIPNHNKDPGRKRNENRRTAEESSTNITLNTRTWKERESEQMNFHNQFKPNNRAWN